MSQFSALSYNTHNQLNRTVLNNLRPETRIELDAISAPTEYATGATILRQGDASGLVHILRQGRAKVFTSSREGKSLLLKIAMDGDLMGLGAVVRHEPYEMTAEAYGPCMVDAILDRDFLEFLSRHNSMCWSTLQMLAEENQQLLVNSRRVALSGSIAGNVAQLLLDWETAVTTINGNKHFNMMLTHQEIAEMVGTTRETVTRTLGHFRQEGWIRVHGISIEILHPSKMEELSN